MEVSGEADPSIPHAVVPAVTALRRRGGGRVAVELDGAPWRVLPLEAALAAGLDVGVLLDRARARAIRAELRRVQARDAALTALSRRDHTVAGLRLKLESRGVPPAVRETTVETMLRAGLVDDARFACERAAILASRGCGDAMIRDDLEHQGVLPALVADAIASLDPESARAERLLAAEGASPRLLRRLAARGFGEDALEGAIADRRETELG